MFLRDTIVVVASLCRGVCEMEVEFATAFCSTKAPAGWGALARLRRQVNYVAAWRCPEINPAEIVS